jgi:hypothetical protein
MIIRLSCILSLLVLCSCSPPPPNPRLPDSFYVWQRAWTPAVQRAVSEADEPLLPLLAEFADARSVTTVNWHDESLTGKSVPPVLRIRAAALGDAELLPALLSRFDHPTRIQIDLDCPERRLGEYRALMLALRDAWPKAELSATVLPSHLGARGFSKFAASVDYYVLQVHGLEVPQTIDDPVSLLDPAIANSAIRRAERIGQRYRVALPCYAYELNFDRKSGRFLSLNSEIEPARGPDVRRRVLRAEFADLARLVRELRNAPVCEGIIWFRLPVAGDRLTLPRDTVAILAAGEQPQVGCELRTETVNGTLRLTARNTGMLGAGTLQEDLNWPGRPGDHDLLNGFRAEGRPGLLPAQVLGPIPAPGVWVQVGWFRPDDGKLPEGSCRWHAAP